MDGVLFLGMQRNYTQVLLIRMNNSKYLILLLILRHMLYLNTQ